MKSEQIQELVKSLQFSFGNRLDEEQVMFWAEYLDTQPFGICKKVVDWFRFESGSTFIPPISEFSARVKSEQQAVSSAEAYRKDSSKCNECHGLTWSMDDPSGVIPCSFCRPSAYAKWCDGVYKVGTPVDPDEEEGPSTSYQGAAKDNHYTGTPVEVSRARQWAGHLKEATAESSIYPEGDIEMVDNRPSSTPQRKQQEYDTEF